MKCQVCDMVEVEPLSNGDIPNCMVCEAAIFDAVHEELDPEEEAAMLGYPGYFMEEYDSEGQPFTPDYFDYDEGELLVH